MNSYDVIIIGGGQSGLAAAYYLRRTSLSFVILDNQSQGGGAWSRTWKSLRLFSPAQWSSLPGTLMQGGPNYYPTRDEAIEYLKSYETKYDFPIKRPVHVDRVEKHGDGFNVQTSEGAYYAKAVISATGSFANPYIPDIPGIENFQGKIIHSSQYTSPDEFTNKRVAIVGEGNSGAQILAEVSQVAETLWITQKEPKFLPDHIDGRYLFDVASQMYEAQKKGKEFTPPSLGDIVMVESVKDARSRNVLNSVRPFDRFTEDALVWNNDHIRIDAVIFCTGFKASLNHLNNLNIINSKGRIDTIGTRSKNIDGLWLVGYGQWTGFASSTLIGVGRSAKTTVDEIVKHVAAFNELSLHKQ
jgi:putative flavoprotein involved in K+ transport